MSSSKAARKRRRQNRPPATDSLTRQQELLPPGGLAGAPLGQLVQASSSVSTSYSGPIPPPELLKRFDEIEPGTAKKILQLWEDQSRHRMGLEKYVIHSDVYRSWAGLVCGFLIAVFTIVTGGYLVLSGHDGAGGTIATLGLASLVGVFVYGTHSQRAERVEKAKIMSGSRRR